MSPLHFSCIRALAASARLALWLSFLPALRAADATPPSSPPMPAGDHAPPERVEVQASRLRPYSVEAVTSGGVRHLILRVGKIGSSGLTLLIGDAQEGDEILSIDGQEVAKLKDRWASQLRGKSTLELRRTTSKTAYIIVTTTSHQTAPSTLRPLRAGDGQGPLSGRR